MKNRDHDIPRSVDSGPLLLSEFDTNIFIFWGPGNSLTNYPAYTAPSNWRGKEQINIPRVVRLIHNSLPEYESNDYSDDSSPPVPPVPPASCTSFRYAISAITYTCSETPDRITNGWDYEISTDGGATYYSSSFVSINASDTVLSSILLKVIQFPFTVLYSGSLFDAGLPFISKAGYRYISWYVQCNDGAGHASERLLTTNLFGVGDGDPTQPPRCWVYNATTMVYVSEVSFGTGVYASDIMNYYGCGTSPGSPPAGTPPPNPPPIP